MKPPLVVTLVSGEMAFSTLYRVVLIETVIVTVLCHALLPALNHTFAAS